MNIIFTAMKVRIILIQLSNLKSQTILYELHHFENNVLNSRNLAVTRFVFVSGNSYEIEQLFHCILIS